MSQVAETQTVKTVEDIIAAAQGERRIVPVKSLEFSSHNVRTPESYSQESIIELAALIESQGGVLQNLIGYDETKKNKPTGNVCVSAGGRRLVALNYLLQQGKINEEFPVPVLIVAEDIALEVSLAENSGREEMHPADEFLAFQRMISEQGKTIEQVAVAFGVTPLTVERRLKLARLAPMFIELYRKNEVDMSQLQALALVDDQDKQVKVWKSLPSYNRSAHYLKQALTQGEVNIATHPVAKYVGAQAYIKAGGTVRGDLFEQGHGYIDNIDLLNSRATEKMSKTAKKLEKEGAKFVDMRLEGEMYYIRQEFVNVPMTLRELPKKEAEKRAKLEAEINDLSSKIEQHEANDEFEAAEALETQRDGLQEKLEEIDSKNRVPDPRYADVTGAVIFINRQGQLEKLVNVVSKNDMKKAEAVAKGENPDAIMKQGRPAHSERLVRLLTAHRTAAIQAALTGNPNVALAALVAGMLDEKFDHRHTHVNVRFTSPNYYTSDPDKTIDGTRAGLYMEEQFNHWSQIHESIEGDTFTWALAQPQEVLLQALAYCTAQGFDSIESTEDGTNKVAHYMTALNMDMADWWKPTAETYLNYVPKAKVLETVTEATTAEDAAAMASHKKAALIGAAQAKIEESRWIPTIFRI